MDTKMLRIDTNTELPATEGRKPSLAARVVRWLLAALILSCGSIIAAAKVSMGLPKVEPEELELFRAIIAGGIAVEAVLILLLAATGFIGRNKRTA